MEERLKFLADYLAGDRTMTDLCVAYGVSRPTGYQWVASYRAEGLPGLQDRSRRPHTSPGATAPSQVEALIAFRRRHPEWGPRKLLDRLQKRAPQEAWPAPSTAGAILKREGLVVARRR